MTEKTFKLYTWQGHNPSFHTVTKTEKMENPPTNNMHYAGQYHTLEELIEDNKDKYKLDCTECGTQISTDTKIITNTIPPVCETCYRKHEAAKQL